MRARLLAIVLLTACASRDEPDEACPPAQSFEGRCLPASCGDDEVRLDDACAAVGATTCAEGFARAESGCVPVLPETPCEGSLVAFPGDTACHAVDACVDARFPPGDGVRVDGAAVAGGDGSSERPLRTIGEGVARAKALGAARVLVAAGTYAERLVLDAPIELRGVCSERVRIVPRADELASTTVRVAANATIASISLVGAGHARGVEVDGGASLALDGVAITGHGVGVDAARAATPAVPHLRLTNVAVRNARSAVQSYLPTEALRVYIAHADTGFTARGDASLRTLVVEDTTSYGVAALGAKLELLGSLIRRVGAGSENGGIGVGGFETGSVPELTVIGSTVSAIEGVGISIARGRAVVRGSTVRDGVRPSNGSNLAAAIAVSGDGALEANAVTLLRSSFVGVLAFGGTVALERVLVRGVSADGYGLGVALLPSLARSEHVLRGVLVESTAGAGILVAGVSARATDVRVRDVRPRDGLLGDGIAVGSDRDSMGNLLLGRLDAHGATVENAARAAIAVFGGELRLSASRLCGKLDLEASRAMLVHGVTATTDEHPSAIEDRGGNVCGCAPPFVRCVARESGLAPLDLPG